MGIIRDFSVESVSNIREMIRKNVDEENEWAIVDWAKDIFSDELDIHDYLNNVSEYQAKMVDKHNVSSKKFDEILYRVNSVDVNYAQRFSALQQRMFGFQNKIIGIAALVTPGALEMGDEDYGNLCNNINNQYNTIAENYKNQISECEESMPRLTDPAWYEKALNFAGGVVTSIVIDVAEGILFVPAIIDGALDPVHTVDYYLQGLDNLEEMANNWVVNNLVTDEESFYYGRITGDAITFVAGLFGVAGGLTTMAGGITVEAGGLVLCGSGVGIIPGVVVEVVSGTAVAVGALEVACAGGASYSGYKNISTNSKRLDRVQNKENTNPDASEITKKPVYNPSPKHDPASGWGSPNPIPDIETGQKLLDEAYSSSKNKQLYNIYGDQLIKFQPDTVNGWHAYAVENPAKEVPIDVLREMLKDNKITKVQYKNFIKNN